MHMGKVADFLRRLRAGKADIADATLLENLPLADFLQEAGKGFPIVLQDRHIGRKAERGLSRTTEFQLSAADPKQETFPAVRLFPIFRSCLLISSYDDCISGIAYARSIRIRPSPTHAAGLIVTIGSGYKLDKMPDGWVTKTADRRATVLSESFLRDRGWRFDVLQPFSVKS